MKYTLLLLLITGCSTIKPTVCPVPDVVTTTVVQKVKVPDQYLSIPQPITINADTATQKDVATFITKLKDQINTLELQINSIKDYNAN